MSAQKKSEKLPEIMPEQKNKFNFFLKIISGPKTALFLFITLLSVLATVNLMHFPHSVPWMKQISGQNYMDLQFYIDGDTAYALLDEFGEKGREAQLYLLWTIDIIIPALAGLAGSAMILFLYGRASGIFLFFQKLWRIAPAASIADYLENAGIFSLVTAYPERWDAVAAITGIMTVLKFILYALTALLILIGAAYRHYPDIYTPVLLRRHSLR